MERREFLKISAAAAAAATLSPSEVFAKGKKKTVATTRSEFGGVKVGAITYSYRSQGTTAGDMLLFSLASGVGSVELMSAPALTFTGSPAKKPADWSLSSPQARGCLEKFGELGEIYRNAGVDIHIIKFSPKANMPTEAIEFMFEACKEIGADGISTELDFATAEKVAPIAEKYGKYLIFHNHGQPANADWKGFEPYLSYGRNIMLNFDAGHYFGFTGKNPCEIVERLHDRIYSIHLKDKTSIDNASLPNKNQPWGQGETPLRELLKLVQSHSGEEGWPVHCDIELEYEIPQDSSSVEEVAKCVEYCRNILL